MEKTEPFDDPAISNADELYRRIPPSQVKDDRPSSANFRNIIDLSVNLARLTTPRITMESESGRDDFLKWRLAGFLAGVARKERQLVFMRPEPDNPAHALVWGTKTKSSSRKLARACRWINWQTDD